MLFLKRYLTKHNFILRKGDNIYILLSLAWNWLLLLKLKLYKLLKGINRPIIHYYAVCWNEEKLLPFVLNYYSKFTDKIIIFDNYSDDHSVDIINGFPSTKIIEFKTDGFNDLVHIDIKNNCWKKSRGKADYVIVCDIDELIYHDEILEKIKSLQADGHTIVKPFGYNMYSTDFPKYCPDKLITEQVKRGVRHPMMDKCILFDPHAIIEINYKPGAHECYPCGRVFYYQKEDIKLLHYKHIGIEQLIARNLMYAQRLSKENIENDYGTPCLRDKEIIVSEFREHEQQAQNVI